MGQTRDSQQKRESLQPEIEGYALTVDEEEYAQLEGFRSSMFKALRKSPAHLYYALTHPEEATDAMLIGRLAHHAILLGPIDSKVMVLPEGFDGRTKEGKALVADAKSRGLIPLKTRDYDYIDGIRNSVLGVKENRQALKSGATEVTMQEVVEFGSDRRALCKARFDLMPDGDFWVDVKTVQDASPNAFSRTVWNLGYHLQAYHYMKVFEAVRMKWGQRDEDDLEPSPVRELLFQKRESFMFIAVEKEPPHASNRFLLSEKYYEYAREEWKRLMEQYLDCVECGIWPSYPDNILVINPPAFIDTDLAVERL